MDSLVIGFLPQESWIQFAPSSNWNVAPLDSLIGIVLILPPMYPFASKTRTVRLFFESYAAADSPDIPAPMIIV